MALQTRNYFPFPRIDFLSTSVRTVVLDADGEKVGCVFQVPATGNITTVSFRTGTVTVSDTLKVGLYNVDASGNPDTSSAYGSMVAGTVSSLSSNTIYTVTLGTQASATEGDFVAVVIEFNSYVAGNLQIAEGFNAVTHPRAQLYAAAAWTFQAYSLMFAVGYSGTHYSPFLCEMAASASAATAFNSGSTPDEYATRLYLPFPATISGLWFRGYNNGAGASCKAILYDSTPTAQASTTFDCDLLGVSGYHNSIMFASPYDIAKDTEYWLALQPQDATGIRLYRSTGYPSNAVLGALPGGAGMYEGTRSNGTGTFTAANTNRPMIGAIISAFDDGAGGGSGGMIVHPGMSGGMHG